MPLSRLINLLARTGLKDQSSERAMGLRFEKLSNVWNAEPNAPDPVVSISGSDVLLRFFLNARLFKQFEEEEVGTLRFSRCVKYRLGATNDEGWHRGQCRYSKIAPEWGEFYEIHGDDPLQDLPTDWVQLSTERSAARHFLFYLRDHTFEAIADDWAVDNEPGNALLRVAGPDLR